jgi:hypothetical protein
MKFQLQNSPARGPETILSLTALGVLLLDLLSGRDRRSARG